MSGVPFNTAQAGYPKKGLTVPVLCISLFLPGSTSKCRAPLNCCPKSSRQFARYDILHLESDGCRFDVRKQFPPKRLNGKVDLSREEGEGDKQESNSDPLHLLSRKREMADIQLKANRAAFILESSDNGDIKVIVFHKIGGLGAEFLFRIGVG